MASVNFTDATSRRSEKSQSPPTKHQIAPKYRQSEDLVASLAEASGWVILSRNFRRPGCEIDIIMIRGGILVALEIKYRRKINDVASLISERKKKSLVRGVERFLALGFYDPDIIRIDLAVVSELRGKLRLCGYYTDIFHT